MVWSLTPGTAVLTLRETERGWRVARDVPADAVLLGPGRLGRGGAIGEDRHRRSHG